MIDLQKGVAGLPTAHPAGEIIARAARLARAFRERGLPVVLVNVDGTAPGRTDAGAAKFPRPARTGRSSCPNWTGSPAITPSPSNAGERSSELR